MQVSKVIVEERCRKDLGNIETLKESIESVGLLHPIVVDSRGVLIAGVRRLEAFKLLGRKDIPATTVRSLDDAVKALIAERDENTARKEFTTLERHALAKRLEPLERKAAKERERTGQARGRARKHGKLVGEKFPPTTRGKSMDKVAEAVGLSRTTLRKVDKVLELAKENPERYGEFAEQLDQPGKVDKVFKAATKKKAEELGQIPAEAAKKDSSRRWHEAFHDIYQKLNSLLSDGSIEKLKVKWGPEGCKRQKDELRRITAQLQQVIDQL